MFKKHKLKKQFFEFHWKKTIIEKQLKPAPNGFWYQPVTHCFVSNDFKTVLTYEEVHNEYGF